MIVVMTTVIEALTIRAGSGPDQIRPNSSSNLVRNFLLDLSQKIFKRSKHELDSSPAQIDWASPLPTSLPIPS